MWSPKGIISYRQMQYPSGLIGCQHKKNVACPCTKCIVTVASLLKTKEWRGSTVSTGELNGKPTNVLMHPSGAIVHLFVKG